MRQGGDRRVRDQRLLGFVLLAAAVGGFYYYQQTTAAKAPAGPRGRFGGMGGPNQAVPVLEHDGFVLTESSAILKYLADLTDSPAYPKELKARARVNEVMDFFNTYLMRDYVYGLVYSRVLAHYRLSGPAHAQSIALHEPKSETEVRPPSQRPRPVSTWRRRGTESTMPWEEV